MLLSGLAFGQDPNCYYNIVLKQVEMDKYDYRIFLEDQGYERMPLEHYHQDFPSSSFPNHSHLIKTNDGKKKVLLQTFYTHCSSRQKDDLRVIISRKNKNTGEIEFMYTEKPVEESYTEVIFKKFKAGKRKAKINRHFTFENANNYED